MRIGITFNVRGDETARHGPVASGPLSLPLDDADEEFDSPETIAALADAIASFGHDVELLGDGEPLLHRLLNGPRPALVWNLAEGTGGGRSREARVPAVLEMLGIPYTASDPLTLAAALDKDCAKRLVAQANLPTPPWAVFDGDWPHTSEQLEGLALPAFVKPAYEGSSKGILTSSVIDNRAELREAVDQLYNVYRQPILIEEFIEGDELTVGMVGNRPPEILGIMRVLPQQASTKPFVYSLEVKRDWRRQVRYECPAKLSTADQHALTDVAQGCWTALGCRDVARLDFRLRRGIPYFLEANPLPGMSPVSGDLVIIAAHQGIEYRELIGRVLMAALERLSRHERGPTLQPAAAGRGPS